MKTVIPILLVLFFGINFVSGQIYRDSTERNILKAGYSVDRFPDNYYCLSYEREIVPRLSVSPSTGISFRKVKGSANPGFERRLNLEFQTRLYVLATKNASLEGVYLMGLGDYNFGWFFRSDWDRNWMRERRWGAGGGIGGQHSFGSPLSFDLSLFITTTQTRTSRFDPAFGVYVIDRWSFGNAVARLSIGYKF